MFVVHDIRPHVRHTLGAPVPSHSLALWVCSDSSKEQPTATEHQPRTSTDTQTHPRRTRRRNNATWDTASACVRVLDAPDPRHSLALWLDSDHLNRQRTPTHTTHTNTDADTADHKPRNHQCTFPGVVLFRSRVAGDSKVVPLSSLVRWLLTWNFPEHCVT